MEHVEVAFEQFYLLVELVYLILFDHHDFVIEGFFGEMVGANAGEDLNLIEGAVGDEIAAPADEVEGGLREQ